MQGVILEDLQFTMKGADEEDPQFPWMFVKFLHPVQGSFYFLFQNLLPSHFTIGQNCFSSASACFIDGSS
jgi:hypothetical protein